MSNLVANVKFVGPLHARPREPAGAADDLDGVERPEEARNLFGRGASVAGFRAFFGFRARIRSGAKPVARRCRACSVRLVSSTCVQSADLWACGRASCVSACARARVGVHRLICVNRRGSGAMRGGEPHDADPPRSGCGYSPKRRSDRTPQQLTRSLVPLRCSL